jgi:hypothetical protein
MNELQGFVVAVAAQPIFWVLAAVAVVSIIGALLAGWSRPGDQTICEECSRYGGGHFDWCSKAKLVVRR